MIICPRCDRTTNSHQGSRFNLQDLCLDCTQVEKQHPLYEIAAKAEHEAFVGGNWNYEGIGAPKSLTIKNRTQLPAQVILYQLFVVQSLDAPNKKALWEFPVDIRDCSCGNDLEHGFFDWGTRTLSLTCQHCGETRTEHIPSNPTLLNHSKG